MIVISSSLSIMSHDTIKCRLIAATKESSHYIFTGTFYNPLCTPITQQVKNTTYHRADTCRGNHWSLWSQPVTSRQQYCFVWHRRAAVHHVSYWAGNRPGRI